MGDTKIELLQGTLDLMILKSVSQQPMHGFGIARAIERVTDERLTVDEGALYPALHRMEKRGWLEAEWQMTENRRRAKYYQLTAAGREELASLLARWDGARWAVDQVIKGTG